MLPYRTLILPTREIDRALYLQVSDNIIKLIKDGIIAPNTKLPGSRKLAEILSLNRLTIVAAYEEIAAQGWIETLPSKGSFVRSELPIIKPQKLIDRRKTVVNTTIRKPIQQYEHIINRGSPDERLAPLNALARAYRNALKKTIKSRYLINVEIYETSKTEQVLANFLNRTRGLNCTENNILVTQGSQMGIYIAAQCCLSEDDIVVVGESNYSGANKVFTDKKTVLRQVPVDQEGLNIDAISIICRKERIQAVYLTPHHHLPTTVTLTVARRMQLLELAKKYGFLIIEDDYDYDYHYQSSPLLPLASVDDSGQVIYVGSMSKNLAPGIRFGYVVASPELIGRFKEKKKTIDRHGDLVLSVAMQELIGQGELERHLRKSLPIYKNRRDSFCQYLTDVFGSRVSFKKPEGGLAVWTTFDPSYDLVSLANRAAKKGLYFSNGLIYNPKDNKLNSTRMGFASLNDSEMRAIFDVFLRIV